MNMGIEMMSVVLATVATLAVIGYLASQIKAKAEADKVALQPIRIEDEEKQHNKR
jgi:hypothetical protein